MFSKASVRTKIFIVKICLLIEKFTIFKYCKNARPNLFGSWQSKDPSSSTYFSNASTTWFCSRSTSCSCSGYRHRSRRFCEQFDHVGHPWLKILRHHKSVHIMAYCVVQEFWQDFESWQYQKRRLLKELVNYDHFWNGDVIAAKTYT